MKKLIITTLLSITCMTIPPMGMLHAKHHKKSAEEKYFKASEEEFRTEVLIAFGYLFEEVEELKDLIDDLDRRIDNLEMGYQSEDYPSEDLSDY